MEGWHGDRVGFPGHRVWPSHPSAGGSSLFRRLCPLLRGLGSVSGCLALDQTGLGHSCGPVSVQPK